jgi:hypothetical protein
VTRARRIRADGTPILDLDVAADARSVGFVAGPKEIVTIVVGCGSAR